MRNPRSSYKSGRMFTGHHRDAYSDFDVNANSNPELHTVFNSGILGIDGHENALNLKRIEKKRVALEINSPQVIKISKIDAYIGVKIAYTIIEVKLHGIDV